MALTKMTVCDDTSGTAEYPYQFYARDSSEAVHVVNIIMPLGGKETGLYRFPKPGERVIVDNDGAESLTYYLIGYLPGVDDEMYNILSNAKPIEDEEEDSETEPPFETEKDALRDAEAMILRYEQTGKTTPEDGKDERYSELGFYRKATHWRTTDTNYRSVPRAQDKDNKESDSVYSTYLDGLGFKKNDGESDTDHINRIISSSEFNGPVFPKIDRVNIQSAGDMRATAKNYQLLKSKRFELLVDCGETTHTEKELSQDELPLGDNIGDDPVLHAGDAHIRAGNRVVIKAGSEITLQVGKTVVTISDAGLKVLSKLVNSNITNAYDATFNMSGQDVSLYGRRVKINADTSLGIGDTYGGSFATSLGVVSIGGREIKADSYDSMKYGMLIGNAAAQYIQSVTAGSMAVNGKATNTAMVMGCVKFATEILNHLAEVIEKLVDVVRTWAKFTKMSGAVRQEKIAKEAEEKTENAKKKLDAAQTAEKDAQTTKDKAATDATNAKTKYEEKKTGYDNAMKNGTDAEKTAAREQMDQAYKELRMAEDKQQESEETYESSQDDTKKAQSIYDMAKTTSDEEREAAVSKWSTEVTKVIKKASKKKPGASPPPLPTSPKPPLPNTSPPPLPTSPKPPLPSKTTPPPLPTSPKPPLPNKTPPPVPPRKPPSGTP